ncbi:hypothetical protein [Streptomyces prunicolor]|uniref:hypothetical protein n=1 Tax=Streptomyces prunicolor TaxID=67348 RepID=UPI0033FBF2A0
MIPDGADPAEADRVQIVQVPRVKELTAAGYVLRLWKPAADGTTIALCHATDQTNLRAKGACVDGAARPGGEAATRATRPRPVGPVDPMLRLRAGHCDS